MVSESEEEEHNSVSSPRSRREQIQDVVESYKEKLSNIKGQVLIKNERYERSSHRLRKRIMLFSGVSHDGQPEPDV